MSLEIEQTVDINAPAERIWAILVDVERWFEWTPSIAQITLLDSGKLGLGSTARIRQPKLPSAIWRVTQFVPGSGFVWESKAIGANTAGEHWITSSQKNQCKVALRIKQGGFLAKILAPWTSKLTREYMNMEAQGLKKRSEDISAVGP